MLQLIILLVWVASLLITFFAAWGSGDQALRTSASACLVAYVISIIVGHAAPHWFGPNIGILMIDAALAATLTWVAMRRLLVWSILSCGFQLGNVGLHAAYILAPHYRSSAYMIGLLAMSFFVVFAIFGGAMASLRQGRAIAATTGHG